MTQLDKNFQMYMEQHLPLKEVVFRALREAILQGEYEAGDRLMEIHLAERLGVSRTPIREALHMLEDDGLVVLLPRRGAIVAGITEEKMKDVLEVRRALEELAVELAAFRITDQEVEGLKEAAREFGKSIDSADVNTIAKADERFHYLISRATRNQQLIQLLDGFREQMYRYRVTYLRHVPSLTDLVKEHEMIVKHLEGRNSGGAIAAVRIHIDRQQQIMLEQVDSFNREMLDE